MSLGCTEKFLDKSSPTCFATVLTALKRVNGSFIKLNFQIKA
jgi:hypothetical protein